HRGSRERERRLRARRIGRGGGSFAPTLVQIAVSPVAAIEKSRILFLESNAGVRHVERVNDHPSTRRGGVAVASRLDRQGVAAVGERAGFEQRVLKLRRVVIGVDLASKDAVDV